MVGKRWGRLGIAPAPLDEVWAPLPARAPHPVPLAKPSHDAAFCGGSVVWHISRHRQTGDTVHRNETRGRAKTTPWAQSQPLSQFLTMARLPWKPWDFDRLSQFFTMARLPWKGQKSRKLSQFFTIPESRGYAP